jgi:hypothetical protein
VDYQVTEDDANPTLSVTGTFYDPDYGYVTVTTPSLLTYGYCPNLSAWIPTSGTVQVLGANGAYGEFDATSCLNYKVCVDDGVNPTCTTKPW